MLNQPGNKPTRYSFCCSSFLYNNLQNSRDRTLIIDTREGQTYNNHHIAGSINLTKERLEEVRRNKATTSEEFKPDLSDIIEALKQDEAAKFSNRRRCFCFFIMNENSLPKSLVSEIKRLGSNIDDEETFQLLERFAKEALEASYEEMEEKESIMSALELFRVLQQDRVRELFLLMDGAESFFTKYPYMSITTDSSSSTPHSVEYDFPHDMLDGRLFLGSFNQSEKYCLVSNLKITHILNMTCECNNVHEDKGIKYLKVSILDEADKNISAHFESAYQFIHQALTEDENNRVLVHCAMGKSRSATMVIMYLMKTFLWSFDKAFSIVKRKREIICPNEGFTQQLQSFESRNLSFVSTIKQK